jgi:hypothetical protein
MPNVKFKNRAVPDASTHRVQNQSANLKCHQLVLHITQTQGDFDISDSQVPLAYLIYN